MDWFRVSGWALAAVWTLATLGVVADDKTPGRERVLRAVAAVSVVVWTVAALMR